MKKSWIIAWLIPVFSLISCLDDTSAYLPQAKEDVVVDSVDNEHEQDKDTTEVLPDGILVPGIHLVKLEVARPDGQVMERRFKYFMPISIDESKPISLIFDFHGSYTFDAGVTPDDPLSGISTSHPLIQHAIKENCVICFPAGSVEMQEDGSGAVNWQDSEKHLPFVDAMIDYFESRTPSVDPNRIYSTGQSSGAIFSFVLAFERSSVFAAITPRAGQMSLDGQTEMPERAVPVRVFAGEIDETVIHSAVIENMTAWAEKIGGYFASDMVLTEDSFEIEKYKKVDTRIWSGGRADYQIYTLKDEGHGIAESYVLPYMWEFMASHTLDGDAGNMFITSSLKEITAQCGEPVEFNVNYTDGAVFDISKPKGWNLRLEGKTVRMTGPSDFYGDIDREGDIVMTATLNGKTVTESIPFKLTVPKDYFEVGDIYYNGAFEPVGVVCWVNNANIREAKIVNIDEQANLWYAGGDAGLGLGFSTPDRNDGEGNTRKMVEQNQTLETPLVPSSALFLWASAYTYGNVSGWYLPAVGELEAVRPNIDKVNATLEELGGKLLQPLYSGDFQLYSSTTEVKPGENAKTIYGYNFTKGTVIEGKAKNAGSEYLGFVQGRAFRKVTK